MDAEELNELDKLEALASMVSDSSESEDEKDSSGDDNGNNFQSQSASEFQSGIVESKCGVSSTDHMHSVFSEIGCSSEADCKPTMADKVIVGDSMPELDFSSSFAATEPVPISLEYSSESSLDSDVQMDKIVNNELRTIQ